MKNKKAERYSIRTIANYICFIVAWLLWAFNVMNRDRVIYEAIYLGCLPEHEPLFILLCDVFNKMGLSYQQFYFLVFTVCALMLLDFVKRKTDYWGLFWLLLIAYPLPFLITIVRNAIAICIVLYGIKYLESNKVGNAFKYLLLVLIGTGIHYSTIIFSVFVLAITRKKKTLLWFSVAVGLGMVLVSCTNVVHTLLDLITDAEKVLVWFEGKPSWGIVISVVVHLYTYIIFRIGYSRLKNAYDDEGKKRYLNLVYNINSISFMYIGLYGYNMQFLGRIYMVTVLLNYTVIIEVLKNKCVKWDIWEKAVYILAVVAQIFIWTFGLYRLSYFELFGYLFQNCLLKF